MRMAVPLTGLKPCQVKVIAAETLVKSRVSCDKRRYGG
jgi:hypothetical protein